MGRTTRDGLSIDFPDRPARCHLLQQDRQRAWRTHYGRGNPRRTAETKTFELTIDDVRLALAGFLHAGDRGIIVRDGGRSQVFVMTPQVHARKLFLEPYQHTWIPYFLLWSLGLGIPFVELIAGWLLVAGFLRRPIVMSLGFLLLRLRTAMPCWNPCLM